MKSFLRTWKELSVEGDVQYQEHSVSRQLVLPSKYRQIALIRLHEDTFHQGRERFY